MGRAGFGTMAALAISGCATEVYVGDPPAPTYTYYRDVQPVLEARCVGCHEDGEDVPLGTYREAYLFRDVVLESVLGGTMPPPDEDDDDAPVLHEEEVRAIAGWVEQGGLMGNPADAPDWDEE